MKKWILLIFIFTISLACSNDDAANDPMNGIWNLVTVSCECEIPIFEKGTHVWDFDLSTNQLTVVNTIEEDLQILDTGMYSFSRSGSTITIQNVTYDYYFQDAKLYLGDAPEIDGPLLQFERN